MRPIQTLYRGRRFRSRLEARWAVFFDALNIKWVYQPEGHRLATGETYQPDFFLPGVCGKGIYVEVKPDRVINHKARQFASEAGASVLMACEAPGPMAYDLLCKDGVFSACFDSRPGLGDGLDWNPGYVNADKSIDECHLAHGVLAAIVRARSKKFDQDDRSGGL